MREREPVKGEPVASYLDFDGTDVAVLVFRPVPWSTRVSYRCYCDGAGIRIDEKIDLEAYKTGGSMFGDIVLRTSLEVSELGQHVVCEVRTAFGWMGLLCKRTTGIGWVWPKYIGTKVPNPWFVWGR